MFTAQARVATDAAERYAKQLASHLGRKIPTETTPDGYRLAFQGGEAVLAPQDDHLLMRATAPDEAALGVIQNVLGSHLERFGQRKELTVTWEK